jgi:hypothetical protein
VMLLHLPDDHGALAVNCDKARDFR